MVKEEKQFLGGVGESLHACSAKYMARTVLLICSMYCPYFAPAVFYMAKKK